LPLYCQISLTYLHDKATKARRQAAVKYEQETGNRGAVAMIDTDFASDIFSYSEDDLSDDAQKRRTEADVGKSANMIVGHQWRSMNVSFLPVMKSVIDFILQVRGLLTLAHTQKHEGQCDQ